MLPSFEIYLSILSDSWMPWLAENRKEEKFESLLFALTPFGGKNYQVFFSQLISALKNTRSAVSPNFIKEAAHLAKQMERRDFLPFAAHFVQLSSVQPRELFYHSLTGFAMDGYHNWLYTALPAKEGEISAYIITRTIDRLYSVLKIPVMDELALETELRLLYVVKVALAGIQSGLMQKFGNFYRGVAVAYHAPDAIRNEIKQSSLSPAIQKELHDLLEKVLHSDVQHSGSQPAKKETSVPNINHTIQHKGLPEKTELEQLAKSWEEDVMVIKEAVGQLKDTPVYKQPLPEKMLNSGEVIKLLGISKSTLHRYRKNSTIKFHKIGGKYMYVEADILKLLKQQDNKHN